MWNRILDQLDRLKQLGDSHGDLKLEHLLVHPRDHGIAFCGWGKARLGPQNDLEMSARCIASLLGKRAPKPLLELTQSAHQFEGPSPAKKRTSESCTGDLWSAPIYTLCSTRSITKTGG